VLTPEGLVESANPEFEEIVGTAADRLVGQLLWDVVRFEPDREGLAELTIGEFRNAMLDRVEWRSDDCELSNCSRRVAVSVVLTPLLNGERVDGAVLVVRDITERKEAQALLAWQASHDALTGIPNRSELHRRLEQAMLHGDAHGHPPALLYLDLDRFKAVNDTYGHAAGDQLLVQVTERVVAAVRGSDTVARLSGDEFAVLCEGIDEKDALIVGTRIVTSLERPFLIDGHEVGVSASVGVAFGADLRASVAAVLRAADAAMYRAKQDGRGCVRVDEHADEPAPALAGRRRDDRG
jgi:diguanylate cyclase (GGDEF)-like protein/PAS domain S-box-containing protein